MIETPTKTPTKVEDWPLTPVAPAKKEREAIKIWRESQEHQCFGTIHKRFVRRVFNVLEVQEQFCAMGLLKSVAATRVIMDIWQLKDEAWLEDFGFPCGKNSYAKNSGVPCPTPCCRFTAPAGPSMIVHWNDTHMYSFKQIADLAEQHPELVFAD